MTSLLLEQFLLFETVVRLKHVYVHGIVIMLNCEKRPKLLSCSLYILYTLYIVTQGSG